MRISTQAADFSAKQAAVTATPAQATASVETAANESKQENTTAQSIQQLDKESLKNKLEPAIQTINEVLESTSKTSKFVLHEGLDKYYVRLVDSKTDEVIKEIPPERLLDAFYELQKLAGMIVDEKI